MIGDPEVLKTQETAILLGVHVEPVRQLAWRNAIPSFKVGRAWRFRKAALVRWEDEPPDLENALLERTVRTVVGAKLASVAVVGMP